MGIELYKVKGFFEKGYREGYIPAHSKQEAKKKFEKEFPYEYTSIFASKVEISITGYTMNLEQVLEVKK